MAHNLVSPAERIVVLNTGNGLKDIASAMKGVEAVGTWPQAIPPPWPPSNNYLLTILYLLREYLGTLET